MKVYLFTGAAGYIGSHTAYAFLRSCDCKIIILDNLSTGFIENIFFLISLPSSFIVLFSSYLFVSLLLFLLSASLLEKREVAREKLITK